MTDWRYLTLAYFYSEIIHFQQCNAIYQRERRIKALGNINLSLGGANNLKETEESEQQSSFKDKLHRLWDDDRTYRQKLVLSLITVFAACFTFLFFGPVEITAYGQGSLVFNAQTALPIMAVFAVIVCAVIALAIALLRGRVFNYILTAVFSALLCGYIQGNFLNGTLGALTGDAIKWQLQKGSMLLNIFVCLAIFLIPFFVLYFNKNIWKKLLVFVSAALVVMQSVALITIFAGSTATVSADKGNFLSTKEFGDYSSKHNTLVFLLDRLDYDHIEEITKQNPGFFNKLDGFTTYDNAISEHARTKPAITYLMTNDDRMWQIPVDKYFEDSWSYQGRSLLKDLKSANYTIDFYTDINCMFGSGKTVKNYVSNLSHSSNGKLNQMLMIQNLTDLSAYRYFPTAFKPFFWCYTDDVNNGIYSQLPVYQIDETQYDQLQLKDFKVTGDTNYFKFYHFMGSHTPYTVKADGTKSAAPTDVISQTEGNFNILFRAFDKMKKLGIYKNTTIVILADHGEPVSDKKPMQKANRIGFFYKPAGSEGTPLKTSHAPVSFRNMPATFAKACGLKDYAKYGKPIDEVGENDNVVRYFYKCTVEGHTEKEVYVYQITGNAADFKHWKIIKVQPAKYSFW